MMQFSVIRSQKLPKVYFDDMNVFRAVKCKSSFMVYFSLCVFSSFQIQIEWNLRKIRRSKVSLHKVHESTLSKMADKLRPDELAAFKAAFDMFDKNQDGTISTKVSNGISSIFIYSIK